MKNITFLQLVLGVSGGMLIWAGVKNEDLLSFFQFFVRNPLDAFSATTYKFADTQKKDPGTAGVKPASANAGQAPGGIVPV